MTSMLCLKREGGSVKIHDNSVVEQLISDGDHHTREMLLSKEYSCSKSCHKRPSTMPCRGTKKDQYLKTQDWLNEKTVKNLQDKADAETKITRRLYSPLLETEDTFVRNVDNFLITKYINDLRKKEILHKNWNEQVFERMRGRIIEAMSSSNWPELDRRKRELHKQYLEFINEKGHVFLDTLDPEEYYAQALNGNRPAPIAIKTTHLRDPLLSQNRERNEEEKTILRCLTGQVYTNKDVDSIKLPPLPLVPLGRHGTDSNTWLSMPLHNIDSTPRRASIARMKGNSTKSLIDFDAWSKAKFDPVIVEEELNIQKTKIRNEEGLPPHMARMHGRCTNSSIDFSAWAKERFDSSIIDEEMQIQKKRMFSEENKPPYMYRHKRYVSVDKKEDSNEQQSEDFPAVMKSGSVIATCDG